MAEYVCEIDERPCKHGTAWSVAEKREPIVRCRDCMFSDPDKSREGDTLYCSKFNDPFAGESAIVYRNSFCSSGERWYA